MKTTQTWKIGDCLQLLPEIPDKSIDMILTDLPYGITNCSWDNTLLLDCLWSQYRRIITNTGAIVLTAQQPFTSILIMAAPDLFKYCWVFGKSLPVGHGYAKFRPMSNHEDICVFSKGVTVYNPQFTKRKTPRTYTRNSASLSGASSMTSNDGKTRTLIDKYPNTIIMFNTSNQADKVHPTQKPLELFEYLIKTYTNEGDTVHDSCLGSGTTLEACANLNRNCIGFELLHDWEEHYHKRLKLDNTKLDAWTT